MTILIPGTAATAAGTLKRFSISLANPGTLNTYTTGSALDYLQRFVFALPRAVQPADVTRWRLRAAQFVHGTESAATTPVSVGTVYIGDAKADTDGRASGEFNTAPTATVAAFSVPTDGSYFTSAWQTATLPAGPGVISLGLTAPQSGTGLAAGRSNACWQKLGSGNAAKAGQLAAVGVSQGIAFLDLILEIECVTAAEMWLFVGDSITDGTTTATPGTHETLPGQFAARYPILALNNGFSGFATALWTTNTTRRWSGRFDLTTTVPDGVHILLGNNDVVNSVTAATYLTNLATIIANAKALGAQKIAVGTPLPGNYSGGQETARQGMVTGVRTMLLDVDQVQDYDRILTASAAAATQEAGFVGGDNVHPLLAGWTRMVAGAPLS